MSLEQMDEVFVQSKSLLDPPRIARAMARRVNNQADDIEVFEKR